MTFLTDQQAADIAKRRRANRKALPTDAQQRALIALANAGRKNAGPPRDLRPATRTVLLERGWVREHDGEQTVVLTITQAGREAMVATHPHVTLMLKRGNGYTTEHAFAVDDLEVTDPAALEHWRQDAELARVEAKMTDRRNRVAAARSAALNAKAA